MTVKNHYGPLAFGVEGGPETPIRVFLRDVTSTAFYGGPPKAFTQFVGFGDAGGCRFASEQNKMPKPAPFFRRGFDIWVSVIAPQQ